MGKFVALITGSNRGIGKACAILFAKNGCDVVINYCHHEQEAIEVKNYIEENYNVNCMVIKCDISQEEEVEEMVNQIVDAYGTIDILVNNASVCRDSLFMDKSIKAFRRILDVNLIGTYLCSKYVGKVMLEKKCGKIINVASTNAIDTYYPESCDYDASKAGVVSLTHNMAREFAPNILVNCVCPGWVKTDMNKDLSIEQINEERKNILVGRFAEPEEIAKVICFLASPQASYINDSIIRVDGGKYNG
ncbi:MAG: SDR family oxidoreductase [Mycoplasmatota bacterium]|nr:SDR family oxidoreductase [Mycoplasmatota bacterium]